MRVKVTCLQRDCGYEQEFDSMKKFVEWIREINPHGMHYPAQRSNEFKVVLIDDKCPPLTPPMECPYNWGKIMG